MNSIKISALSLALLLPVATFAAEPAVVKPSFGAKVTEVVSLVKAKLPAMPTKEQAKVMVKNAPKATYEFVKAHPYKATAIVAATAAVAYAVYKVCTAKKATKTAKTK